MSRIIIVDDEELLLSSLKRLLHSTPCTYGSQKYALEVETFTSPIDALARIREKGVDVVIADYRMPEMNGADFLIQVRALQPDAELILLSGHADVDGIGRAYSEAQIFRFIGKPWNDYILVSTLAEALNYRDLLLENRKLSGKLAALGDGDPKGR